MAIEPHIFLNSALAVADSPAELARMLSDGYLRMDETARGTFTMTLIWHIAATEAVRAAPRA